MAKNYDVMNVGTFHEDLAQKGRVTARETLGLSGCEVSFNYMPVGKSSSFFHSHKLNEEVYIVISGNGTFKVDDDEFPIHEGSVIKVSPAGVRGMKAGTEDLVYICIQTQSGSLVQASGDDGVRSDSAPTWSES